MFYRLVQLAIQTLVLLDTEPITYPLLVSGRTMLLIFGGAYGEFTETYPHLKEQADFISDTIAEYRAEKIDYRTACQRIHEAVLAYEADRERS